jgi:hypothetical protein
VVVVLVAVIAVAVVVMVVVVVVDDSQMVTILINKILTLYSDQNLKSPCLWLNCLHLSSLFE